MGKKIAEFLDRACQIALKIQKEKGKKLKDFEQGLAGDADLVQLRGEVEQWAVGFGYRVCERQGAGIMTIQGGWPCPSGTDRKRRSMCLASGGTGISEAF